MLTPFRSLPTRCRSTLLLLLALTGCPQQELAPLGPCTVSSVRENIEQTGLSKVDLLFMIDDSASMSSKQLRMAQQLPRLVQVLTSGDRWAGRESKAPTGLSDKERFFPAVESLHLGVVTSSLGVLPSGSRSSFKSCVEGAAADGKLRTDVRTAVAGEVATSDDRANQISAGMTLLPADPACKGRDLTDAPYLSFEPGGGEAALEGARDVAFTFGCVAKRGSNGCPQEMGLEAVWRALAPSEGKGDLHTFVSGGHGEGDPRGANAGFLREDALLAVILVTDEDDCSVTEEGRALVDETDRTFSVPSRQAALSSYNLRCAAFADDAAVIQPVSRYVEGLRSLKPDHPDRIVFSAITGVPEDVEGSAASYDEILTRSDMQAVEDPTRPGFLTPVCVKRNAQGQVEERAYPGRRYIEVAKGFPQGSGIYSICRDDFGPAVGKIIDTIARKLRGGCLPRRLTPNDDGLVQCEVHALLPKGEKRCDPDKGLIGKPIERQVGTGAKTDRRLACKIAQVPVRSGKLDTTKVAQGWYYDDFSPEIPDVCPEDEPQRIAFTEAATPEPGSGATIDCYQPFAHLEESATGVDAVNTRCDGDDAICSARSEPKRDGYKLICVDKSCQIRCSTSPDCPPGWVCAPGKERVRYCQQPTCPTDVGTVDTEG